MSFINLIPSIVLVNLDCPGCITICSRGGGFPPGVPHAKVANLTATRTLERGEALFREFPSCVCSRILRGRLGVEPQDVRRMDGHNPLKSLARTAFAQPSISCRIWALSIAMSFSVATVSPTAFMIVTQEENVGLAAGS